MESLLLTGNYISCDLLVIVPFVESNSGNGSPKGLWIGMVRSICAQRRVGDLEMLISMLIQKPELYINEPRRLY